jgi:hypothetical protein
VGRPGDGAIEQDVLAHLAGRGLRQLAELDGVRGLEAREVPAGEGDESSSSSSASGLSVTYARGRSPHFSSGCPTTAASTTLG